MNAVEQASIIYPLLLEHAKTKTTLTYGDVLDALGYSQNTRGHAIRAGMDLIVLYCMERGYPQLTSLIVNKNSGEPTEGYAYGEGGNVSEEHRKCFNHIWDPEIGYTSIWDRRFELRERFNLPYGSSSRR